MKRLKRWLLPLVTVLLIGAGAGMPWAAARVQDLYGISAQEVLPLDAVSLRLRKESEIGAILRLISEPHDAVEWTGKTGLTEEDACAMALDALAALDQYDLLESGWMGDYGYIEPDILERLKAGGWSSASPLLLVSDEGVTAITWLCCWEGNAVPPYEIWIDDVTGLAVSGYIPCPNAEGPEENYRRMDRWAAFFQDYYGIEIQSITDSIYDTGAQFIFPFDPEDGLGTLALSVNMYSFETDFGLFSPYILLDSLEKDDAPYNASAAP